MFDFFGFSNFPNVRKERTARHGVLVARHQRVIVASTAVAQKNKEILAILTCVLTCYKIVPKYVDESQANKRNMPKRWNIQTVAQSLKTMFNQMCVDSVRYNFMKYDSGLITFI